MQLKRDTDYLLRIALYLGERGTEDTEAWSELREISRSTGIPHIVCKRLTELMSENGMLDRRSGPLYRANAGLMGSSMKDLICLTEDTVDVFAVFEKSYSRYRERAELFSSLEKKCEAVFGDVPVSALLNG